MSKEKIRFSCKISTSGTSYVITIPKDFVKHGLINPQKYYEVELKLINHLQHKT